LTLDDYCSKTRFPLTTQEGLTPRQQMFLDAQNQGDLETFSESYPLSRRQQRLLRELQDKAAARPALLQQMLQQMDGKEGGADSGQ